MEALTAPTPTVSRTKSDVPSGCISYHGCIHLVRFVGVTLAQSLHQELERQSGRLGGRQGRRKEILSILRQCLLNTLKTPQICALCLQIDSLSSPHIDLSANKPSFTLHNPKEREKKRKGKKKRRRTNSKERSLQRT